MDNNMEDISLDDLLELKDAKIIELQSSLNQATARVAELEAKYSILASKYAGLSDKYCTVLDELITTKEKLGKYHQWVSHQYSCHYWIREYERDCNCGLKELKELETKG